MDLSNFTFYVVLYIIISQAVNVKAFQVDYGIMGILALLCDIHLSEII